MDKRADYISWDEYFMGVAILASQRSKDPSTQVGACIVDEPFLAIDKVRYYGEPVAAVAADTLEIAMEAVKLIKAEYEA